MTPDRAAILRKLAEPESLLDGLVQLARLEWTRFRDRKDGASLLRFADAIHTTRTQLAVLHTLLERLGTAGDRPALGAREPEASRLRELEAELDRTLAEAERLRGQRGGDGSGLPGAGPGEGPEGVGGNGPPPAGESVDGAWSPDPNSVPFPPYRDQVTGLFSRPGFDAIASGELKRCRRHERPFALVLLDLAASDLKTLRAAAAQVRRSLRESDLVGRHVDRTIALGLGETGADQALGVVARVADALRSVGVADGGPRLGMASFPADGETLPGLVDAARSRFAEADSGAPGEAAQPPG